MSVTVTQAIAYTREMMDAASSAKWSDTWITTVLGLVSWREWGGILKAAPMYRFASRSVTSGSDGTFLYTALDSGAADSKQYAYKVLSVTDGSQVYTQTDFSADPLATATTSQAQLLASPRWYEAGLSIQIVPAAAIALTVAVNYRPPRVDQLSLASVVIDFPDGRESILWLEAAAILLTKGGERTPAAADMRALAGVERLDMYSDLARRSTRPQFVGFPDRAASWGG